MSLTSIHPSNVRSSNNVMNANNTLLNGKSRAYGNLREREREEEEEGTNEKDTTTERVYKPLSSVHIHTTL